MCVGGGLLRVSGAGGLRVSGANNHACLGPPVATHLHGEGGKKVALLAIAGQEIQLCSDRGRSTRRVLAGRRVRVAKCWDTSISEFGVLRHY